MPVRKLTSLDEAEEACWRDPDSPGLWRAIVAVWEFSRLVAPQRFPPGVHRSRTIEEANRRVEQWEREGAMRAAQGTEADSAD